MITEREFLEHYMYVTHPKGTYVGYSFESYQLTETHVVVRYTVDGTPFTHFIPLIELIMYLARSK